MGSGLSMASVNKIKELAEQKEYSLALDIVDSQDLSKSLNPQFLRICGDIYMHNERYIDSRRILLMAHKLAPEGKRVIYSLTHLYLLMGYKDMAKKYFDLYMFDADETSIETRQIKYIYRKADNADEEELYELICPEYIHDMDYDWSFETYLLLKKMGKDDEAKVLAGDYIATYKNTANSEYIADIESGKDGYESHYNVFSAENVLDDDPEQEELRCEEAVLLEADNLRINPKDAEITIMVDDFEEVDMGTKRRLKKMLKSEEKKKNKEQQEEGNNSEETKKDDAGEDKDTESNDTKSDDDIKSDDGVLMDSSGDDVVEAKEDEAIEEKKSKIGFLKKVFSKKHTDDEVDASDDSGQIDDENDTETNVFVVETLPEEEVSEQKEDAMRELHTNKHNPKVSIDFDSDDFTAESDTIEDLKDEDFSNPFDEITVFKKEKEEPIFVPKRKKEFSFDDIDFSSEDEEEFEVDDFSVPDDEFGSMNIIEEESETEIEVAEETEPEEVETEATEKIETEEEPEAEIEPEEVEAEASEEIETGEEPKTEIEPEEVETEAAEEIETEEEPEAEIEPEEVETEAAEEIETEEEPEAEIEPEVVETEAAEANEIEEEPEAEIEPEENEPEEEVETETQTDIQSYTGEEASVSADIDIPIQEEKIPDMSKNKLDFPVFRSSLFPNHNRVVKQVENNFNEIMEKGQDKIQENLLKEEQMQREAEALLASLGIDLNSVEVSSDSMESINKTLYNEPSRDELKASLKIDPVKKDILKKIKEYR